MKPGQCKPNWEVICQKKTSKVVLKSNQMSFSSGSTSITFGVGGSITVGSSIGSTSFSSSGSSLSHWSPYGCVFSGTPKAVVFILLSLENHKAGVAAKTTHPYQCPASSSAKSGPNRSFSPAQATIASKSRTHFWSHAFKFISLDGFNPPPNLQSTLGPYNWAAPSYTHLLSLGFYTKSM